MRVTVLFVFLFFVTTFAENSKERYLIICEDAYAESASLERFRKYRSKEFIVIQTSLNAIGSTTTEVYEYIHTLYNEFQEGSLSYLLFVGNMRNFPFYGETGNNKNAPSFFQYSCIDDQYTDYTPEIHTGIWSVHGENALDNIVYKTIQMDSIVSEIPKRVIQYSTWASKPYVSQMEKLNYILNQALWKKDSYWSPNQFSVEMMVPDVEASPVPAYGQKLLESINGDATPKVIVYQGHGDGDGGWVHPDLKDPAFKYHDHIGKEHLKLLKNEELFPHIWSFACNTGNFTQTDTSFAELWIGGKSGAVSFIGATNVSSNGQQTLDVGLTSAVCQNKELKRIGQIFDFAQQFLFDSAAVVTIPQHPHIGEQQARNTVRMYQLFGDPALAFYPIEGKGTNVDEHYEVSTIDEKNITVIGHHNALHISCSNYLSGHFSLYRLNGQELYHTSEHNVKEVLIPITGYTSGPYILMVKTNVGEYTFKITL